MCEGRLQRKETSPEKQQQKRRHSRSNPVYVAKPSFSLTRAREVRKELKLKLNRTSKQTKKTPKGRKELRKKASTYSVGEIISTLLRHQTVPTTSNFCASFASFPWCSYYTRLDESLCLRITISIDVIRDPPSPLLTIAGLFFWSGPSAVTGVHPHRQPDNSSSTALAQERLRWQCVVRRYGSPESYR